MKKLFVLTLATLFLFSAFVLLADEDEKGEVTKVYDADYIKVKIDGKSYKVELLGSDVPDKKFRTKKHIKIAIKEAEKYVKDLIDNEEVKLVADKKAGDTNKKGHLLRYVYLGKTHVNAELVKKGYAGLSEYSFSKKSSFAKYAKAAEKAKKGIWADEIEKKGLFSIFKRDKDKDKEESTSPSAVKDKDKTVKKDADTSWYKSSMANWTRYVTKTGTKFHKKGCPHLSESSKAIKLKAAKEKGYEPCKTCNPLED